jgi:DDE superfamily endonuclease
MCDLYRDAPALAGRGERVVSTDELTGVQALERLHPGQPMAPGRVERREFEYRRHGTRAFLLNRDVVTGRVFAPTCGATRTKADFVGHIRNTIATDPKAVRWHFAVDNLDIHRCEPLIRLVAEMSGDESDLGVMGKSGVLKDRASRVAYLKDASHKVVFHYTPVHASWLNQIEIWLSILVRKVIKRGSFTSVEDLEEKVLAFIEYYNRTMARPFKWKYKPLKE